MPLELLVPLESLVPPELVVPPELLVPLESLEPLEILEPLEPLELAPGAFSAPEACVSDWRFACAIASSCEAFASSSQVLFASPTWSPQRALATVYCASAFASASSSCALGEGFCVAFC